MKKHSNQFRPAPPPGDTEPSNLAQRFGHESIFAAAVRCRGKWPSPLAREIRQRLEAAGLTVERQFRLGNSLYAADFFLPELRVAILLGGRINGYRRPDAMRRRVLLCQQLGYMAIPATALTDALVETVAARVCDQVTRLAAPAAMAA